MKIHFILIVGILSFSCNNRNNKAVMVANNSYQDVMQEHPGKKLMETNCYVCHSPSASHDDRIGPPMIAIKTHYLTEGTTKAQFIEEIQAWIKNPNADDAKMFGAVRRFGVMPKQEFPDETIEQIADYMFDNTIEQPQWFEAHFNEEKGNHKGKGKGKNKGEREGKRNQQRMHKQQAAADLQTLSYEERGLKYALSTKAVLGKNLMGTIHKQGAINALIFCNENAYRLTDSMAMVHSATIKRVSDKPRNSANQANSAELMYINTFKNDIANSIESTPIVDEMDDNVNVFYPIVTNTMCLQCHGKPNIDIDSKTLKEIHRLYPNDMAVGYDSNQVRGVWSIAFKK